MKTLLIKESFYDYAKTLHDVNFNCFLNDNCYKLSIVKYNNDEYFIIKSLQETLLGTYY